MGRESIPHSWIANRKYVINESKHQDLTSKAPLKLHFSWLVLSWGTTTESTGIDGLYFAINLTSASYIYIYWAVVGCGIRWIIAISNLQDRKYECMYISLFWQIPCSPSRWSEANDNRSLHLNCCTYLNKKHIFACKNPHFIDAIISTTIATKQKQWTKT